MLFIQTKKNPNLSTPESFSHKGKKSLRPSKDKNNFEKIFPPTFYFTDTDIDQVKNDLWTPEFSLTSRFLRKLLE